ncbi:MAG: hypothetical protein NXH95_13730 [Pseudomonadaceae bacterium]|nr:hypothetical protein [Pseudomonadaceae bacterium]
MQIANDVGCTMEELGSRMSAFEYNVRFEAAIYHADPKAYRREHLTADQQVAEMKRVIH